MITYKVVEFNEIVDQGAHGIDIAWIAALDQNTFPMLRHLLPYADTMFNSSQVHSLSAELELLPATSPLVPDVRDHLKRLCDLTGKGAHRQLWFYGD
ncbi:hypothetical protein BZB76_5751 [Actinomadura pelletieri DSM 43383]|uniref:Uncharacterized protein n=1 Tax=Actinomadura pelletieri DSM 43383 TaxID=1120940 RepID=A0A495QH74_9ACTN|nr:hypothetical protein [Actinomadura pelletieri]RKS71262.1 hypothetical protein BZB76_5751 [Actinomadura pelletieri DSM 43383]